MDWNRSLVARTLATILLLVSAMVTTSSAHAGPRQESAVATVWRTVLFDADATGQSNDGLARIGVDDSKWQTVSVPHNWQGYAYDRQVVRGARHGVAWYRTHLTIDPARADERIALMFEGVNSYATVWLNGRPVGRHAGGLTAFTVDVTEAVRRGDNVLAVRVDNPAGITDLPWVSGDDQADGGCCEGSQPFGIFRPVRVVRSDALRVRPFGIYAWGRIGAIDTRQAQLTMRTEIENRSARERRFRLVGEMLDPAGRVVASQQADIALAAGGSQTIDRALSAIAKPRLWSPAAPTLYTLRARLMEGGRVIDEASTPYGIRSVEIRADPSGARRLYLNGAPFSVRGVGEYEHLLGASHSFSPAQVSARVEQVKAAGFNAFRDAHYPHNLAYGDKIAHDGLLWWPQFSSHLWFDNPAFRANFKTLMSDWVRERRNNPAVFLWGLQNESRLPKAFAEEAVAVIRALDPTASEQRLVTTCNGGEGTDWNVPQNWSGTYGGDPDRYGEEMVKQALVGEYGAWRSLGLHAEAPYGERPFSEDRMAALMQKKARLADGVAERSVGQFHWLLTTHENPGRPMRSDGTQIWDGVRELDHVGPANNKGLMTLWGEPLDVYYMFRARQVPRSVAPIVYLVSHTWPDRWATPGVRSGIEVYSNCDTVELFNDAAGRISLGQRRRDAEQRFRWEKVAVRYDTLMARCVDARATDSVRLPLLPSAPGSKVPGAGQPGLTRGVAGMTYLYRVNAGGAALRDAAGQTWSGDRHWVKGAEWGWTSWADTYPELDPALGSRTKTFDTIAGSDTPALFQTSRYGRDALRYHFKVPAGRYRVELYFAEPWYGRTGIDARGWRRFDVAVDGRAVLRDLDVFAEAGFETALKKVVTVTAVGGVMEIAFPRTQAGQAMISAIAIARAGPVRGAAPEIDSDLLAVGPEAAPMLRRYVDNAELASTTTKARWTGLPYELLDAEALTAGEQGDLVATAKVPIMAYLAVAGEGPPPPGWTATTLSAGLAMPERVTPVHFAQRKLAADERITLRTDMPTLFRRALVSPYAPGQFSFARDAGLKEAEAGKVTGGAVATGLKGYGGQGYVQFGSGAGRIAWPVLTDVAGSHRFRLRFWNAGTALQGEWRLRDSSGVDVVRLPVRFAGGEGWQDVAVETPGMINAGAYEAVLDIATAPSLAVDSVRVE
ncbi:malectin domain-containing carbohydrate-binding protein [Sphingomonas sp. PB2P19]|uniref:malectin domain-containing carbohydrate-binding protein n=1 Tax=Sphingomonas rhamnosi TaxID=3096156 RepID=UPI002FC734AA